MAQKKQTQAEKAAAAKKTKTNGAAKPKKYAIQKNTNKQAPTETLQIPARLITSSICAVCFFLFLFAFLNPEAVFLGFILKLVTALIGQIAFYVSIPALLYLFVIHAFSGKRPVVLRTVCLLSFVAICGCISQIAMLMDATFVALRYGAAV